MVQSIQVIFIHRLQPCCLSRRGNPRTTIHRLRESPVSMVACPAFEAADALCDAVRGTSEHLAPPISHSDNVRDKVRDTVAG